MAMQNAAFDVIGVFGFGKDFKATLDLHGEGAQACKCLSEGTKPLYTCDVSSVPWSSDLCCG